MKTARACLPHHISGRQHIAQLTALQSRARGDVAGVQNTDLTALCDATAAWSGMSRIR